jgi:hypothetical protein
MVMGSVVAKHIHHYVPRAAGRGAQILRCACGQNQADTEAGSVTAAKEAKVFFRRQGWHGTVTSGKPPLWHRLTNITVGTDRRGYWMVTWKSLCGYEIHLSAIDANPSQRDDVVTARLRCKKCDSKFERQE